MNIKEIIQRLKTAMDDARGQESHFESWLTQNEGICDAIDALKELDKTEQEPVASCNGMPAYEGPLSKTQRKEPEQEPVATLDDLEQEIYENTRQFVSRDVMEWMLKRYYTTPPQRKPLSNEEIDDIAKNYALNNPTTPLHFARAIEAAHGIKENT